MIMMARIFAFAIGIAESIKNQDNDFFIGSPFLRLQLRKRKGIIFAELFLPIQRA